VRAHDRAAGAVLRRCPRWLLRRGRGSAVNGSEIPGLSGPVWTIVVLALLVAALVAAVYRLYNNRKH